MDKHDIERLYKELYNKKVKTVSHILRGDTATAEDVVQETFTRALKYCSIYNNEKSSEETWINSIMYNVLWDIKKEALHTPPSQTKDISFEDLLDSEQLQNSPEFRAYLIKQISEVKNPIHKKVIRLFCMFGYSSSEITQMGFGISQSNVTTIINRFKESLK